MELLDMMRSRRSIRKYTEEEIPEESLTKILQAGLLSESGKAKRPWEFIVVKDKAMLDELAGCREGGVAMLKEAKCAIVVIGDAEAQDVWVEDCSVAMTNMHLMADHLGVGSCWLQGRLRNADADTTTEEYVRARLGFPEKYKLQAILVLGMPAAKADAYELDKLPMEKVHYEKFQDDKKGPAGRLESAVRQGHIFILYRRSPLFLIFLYSATERSKP